jgi:SAM-dependent methyltransferase
MATTCPIGFDLDRLREQVQRTYERVALDPASGFHFSVGPEYAIQALGYPREAVESLPATSTARFAGVGNPHSIGVIRPGSVVLDHACGAGMDLLLAARCVGRAGRAIGVDLTPAMREQAARAAMEAGLVDVVEIRAGAFEHLPVADSSVDYVISNGVVNLAPDKRRVFSEIARVLRPGGQLYLADVVVERELSLAVRSDPDLWSACVGGAVTEAELASLASGSGLVGARVVRHFDSFRNTSVERKLGRALRVRGVSFHARKAEAVAR